MELNHSKIEIELAYTDSKKVGVANLIDELRRISEDFAVDSQVIARFFTSSDVDSGLVGAAHEAESEWDPTYYDTDLGMEVFDWITSFTGVGKKTAARLMDRYSEDKYEDKVIMSLAQEEPEDLIEWVKGAGSQGVWLNESTAKALINDAKTIVYGEAAQLTPDQANELMEAQA